MAIPTVFATVKAQDFTLKPFTVHKRFSITSTDLVDTGSGYNLIDGVHSSLKTPIGSQRAVNDPTNSFDGSYQHVIWQAYNHLYYKDPYNSYATFEHANRRFTYKALNVSASVLSIPYMDYGEAIKKGSLEVTNSTNGFTLIDDGNGNLYDSSIDTGSFVPNYNLVGYWGFNDQFKHFPYFSGTRSTGNVWYESRVFEPDEPSNFKNIHFDSGVNNSGMCAQFDGSSYIMTHDRPEFSRASGDNLDISFWIKAPISQSVTDTYYNSVISKRGVIRKQTYGVSQKYNQSDQLIQSMHVSASIENESTDVYGYDIEIINSTHPTDAGKLRVRNSSGVSTTELISNVVVADGEYHHVVVRFSTGILSIMIDGVSDVIELVSDTEIYNRHSIMFGALDRDFTQGFSGSLDEIRFYNTSIDSAAAVSLADSSSMSMYQTAVVGNVFYRQGNVVVSPLYPTYQKALKDTWTVNYRGTHTIYQYEVLCRVKKGSFNLTYNPTARKSFKSDLLSNDMTGSLLLPYATTIGLYDDDGDMVAVAKLGQAVQMRDDVDINFLVRWDS